MLLLPYNRDGKMIPLALPKPNGWICLGMQVQTKSVEGKPFSFWSAELKFFKTIMNALEDIILLYTYPRLDAEVSKLRHHLLKAPFCVHPKTGRVCVPVDPAKVDVFDPETVPTVGQLLQELDEAANQDAGDNTRPGMEINLYNDDHYLYFCCVDWEKTSLKPYVDFLDKHVQSILDEARQTKLKSGQYSYLYIKDLQLNDPRRYVLVVSICKRNFDA